MKIRASLPRLLQVWGALLIVVTVAACKQKSAGQSAISTNINGRDIRASIEGRAFVHSENDAATVRFSGHKVRVERTRVILDNAETAAISPGVTLVEIVTRGENVTVTADGTQVLKAKLRK